MKLHSDSLQAIEHIRALAKGKPIVFVSGNFNVIHPGHLRLFRFAKEYGEFLVAGVLDSRSRNAYIDENLRFDGINAISDIDYSLILRESPSTFISALKPDFVVKGKEWEGKRNPEAPIMRKYGGKLLFGSGEITFSSLDLIRQEWGRLNLSTIKKPQDFPKRHEFAIKDLLEIVKRFSELNVCVIGDTIIDEYITCEPLGMSQEDPTIVITPVMQEKFIGGAAIVAAHARSLGAHVDFFSVVGNDDAAKFARSGLKKVGVSAHLHIDSGRPTTLKQRFRAANKTLLRVSHLRQHSISVEIRDKIFKEIRQQIKQADLVIFSDFNYGCLPQSLVDQIVEECLHRNIMMVADSQSSSQVGDISRYKNMTLVTPTEREVRVALHDPESGLAVLAQNLRAKNNAENVIITLGAEGVFILAEDEESAKSVADRLPAMNYAPKDSAGAGDSFLTCASMSLALGYDIWKSAYLSSLAAACQVGRIGNIPLKPRDLRAEIKLGE